MASEQKTASTGPPTKAATGGGRGSKSAGKAKGKKKAASRRGDTRRARERAEGLIDPNVGVVAKDPLRVQILSIAIQRPISPSEFAAEAEIALNVASYQFKVLREHGFLEIVKEIKVRGSTKHMHKATKSGFISDADWGQVRDMLRPGVAGAILQDFNGRVSHAIETGTMFKRDDACLFWAPRCLDETAYQELVKLIAWCIEESQRLEVETVERRANSKGGDGMHVTFAIAGFLSPTSKQVRDAEGKGRKKATPKKIARDKGKSKKK